MTVLTASTGLTAGAPVPAETGLVSSRKLYDCPPSRTPPTSESIASPRFKTKPARAVAMNSRRVDVFMSIERKRIQSVASADEDVLPAVHHVGFRGVGGVGAQLRVPQRVA